MYTDCCKLSLQCTLTSVNINLQFTLNSVNFSLQCTHITLNFRLQCTQTAVIFSLQCTLKTDTNNYIDPITYLKQNFRHFTTPMNFTNTTTHEIEKITTL